MIVKFYIYSCDNRIVDKSDYLRLQAQKDCNVYNQTGIMHPTLLLSYDSSIVNYNYFQIPDWGNRFYYITGMEVQSGGRILLTGSEDVLHTNRDAIMNLTAYIHRTESDKFNKLIVDNKYPSQSNRHCKTISFSKHPFNATENESVYLLTVLGGASND